MRKVWIGGLVVLGVMLPGMRVSAGDAGIGGDWRHPDEDVVVRLVVKGDTATAVVTEAPRPALVGRDLFRNVRWVVDKGVWAGELLAPRRNEYLAMELRSDPPEHLLMTIRKGWFTRKLSWRRAAGAPPAPGR
ncbi:MAG: hypothetical protein VKO21_06975 [Candidatus Sericytochromatia bacterium]|nr:hypothetical protein [Candidatus Sericytochromatia bacterium]